MSLMVLLGLGCGAGLFLIVRGIAPRPVQLATALRRIDRIGESVQQRRTAAPVSCKRGVIPPHLAAFVSGRLGRRVERDLVVMDRTSEALALEKLSIALALGGIAVAFSIVLATIGSAPTFAMSAALCFGALGVGFVVPDLTLRKQASQRRAAFRHALSSYLDLVNVLLAGGAGIETSLDAAAQAGDGWAFMQIRNSLTRARALRLSPWECFGELGDRLGVNELIEVAASVRLAGEQGARVKLSLAAKAAALRSHQMARIEADAQAATERMGLPTVLMFLGFMVLLGYPAMQQIVQGL